MYNQPPDVLQYNDIGSTLYPQFEKYIARANTIDKLKSLDASQIYNLAVTTVKEYSVTATPADNPRVLTVIGLVIAVSGALFLTNLGFPL